MCLAIVLGMPTVGTLAAQPDGIVSSGRVEVVLANEHRKHLEEIKKEFGFDPTSLVSSGEENDHRPYRLPARRLLMGDRGYGEESLQR